MKKHDNYIKEYKLRKEGETFGFIETELNSGISFVLDCGFYKTKYDHIYITDYDFNNSDDLEKKDLSMLFYKHNGVFNTQLISNELLKDETAFNLVLDEFNKECEELS